MFSKSPFYGNTVIALALGLAVAVPAWKCSAADHVSNRQHGAHVHGTAQMNLAVDGENVLLELVSPAMNIVGFEHRPSSAAQRNAVADAAAKLEDGGSLFIFSKAAGCTLISADISSALLTHDHEGDHDHEDSPQKNHDQVSSKPEHHHAAAEEHGEEEHSEFEATYLFTCTNPQKLKALEVNLFTVFPGFKQIEAQILTTSGQTGATINAGSNLLDL